MNGEARGSAIAFDATTVRYPDATRDAISQITFDVAPGEFVVLLGASGSGKSTLLRTVNRLVEPTGGRVLIDGADASTMDPTTLRRGIGYAIQGVGLFAHMTVAANIAIVPELLGWPRERIAERVDELLALVDLDPQRYRTRRPASLSGGEAQRVGVARAIAAEPRVLLMDEPFGAVDPIVRASLQRELLEIVARITTTVLFVTHDVREALHLADKIAILRDGRLVQFGAKNDIRDRPADRGVADLMSLAT